MMKEYVLPTIIGATLFLGLIAGVAIGVNAAGNADCANYSESMNVTTRYIGGECQVEACGRWFPLSRLEYYITELDCP